MITDRRIFTTKWSLCRSFHFTARINLKSFPCLYASYKKPTQIFRNVRWPLFGKPSTPLCRLADRHGRKADPNWKLKISNTSYNGDITQSQARDTRHRWMQEVNSLITDSGPLRADYFIVSRRINQKFKKLYLRNHNRCFFTCSPRPPTLSQRHMDLHVWAYIRHGYIFHVSSKSVQGFRSPRGQNLLFPITLVIAMIYTILVVRLLFNATDQS